jgi:peroxiredoxin
VRRALLASALALAFGACAAPQTFPSPAPEFALPDLNRKTMFLSDLRGHPVLVDFWATWCDPCRESIPSYEKLYMERRDAGFVVVGIDEDDEKADVAVFARKNGIAYPLLRDPKRVAYDAFRVRGLPTAFLIDGKGRIVRRWDAFNAGTVYEVEQALAALVPKK